MKIKQTMIMGCLGATMTLLFAGGAQAAASYCSVTGSPNADGLFLSDMKLNGIAADDCYGFVANPTGPGINDDLAAINALKWQDPLDPFDNWSFLAKDDNPGSPTNGTGLFMGISFTLSASLTSPGTWTLTATDTNGPTEANLPAFFDFVGVLKGGPGYAAWFFDDAKVLAGDNPGTFTIHFTNRGGNIPDLSHLSLYIRAGEDPGNELPEPGSLALLSLGLLGLGALRKSKKVAI